MEPPSLDLYFKERPKGIPISGRPGGVAEALPKILAALGHQLPDDPDIPQSGKAMITKLQALLSGSRDPALATDPELDFSDAAEILLLLEESEKDRR